MQIQLTDNDRQLLRQLQKTESAKRDYIKITTILLLDQGYSVDTIEQILGIDHTTAYRYAQTYRTETISGLLGDAYVGWWGRIDYQQLIGPPIR